MTDFLIRSVPSERQTQRDAGRAVARELVAELAGIAADTVVIDARCADCGAQHGQPRIVGPARLAGRFSVSIAHAGERTIVVARAGGPIGVDAERIDSSRDVSWLTGLTTLPDAHSESAAELLRHWTRVEAVLKADGRGLRVDPALVRVSGDSVARIGDDPLRYRLVDASVGPLMITVAVLD